ncbi:MAG TPA: PQQ-binding-like beta-propeller repeat protein [Pirellulales bacterium]|nr:PQQ-binding-like beta-propeller repeat protein [Pirellulales bacterium]
MPRLSLVCRCVLAIFTLAVCFSGASIAMAEDWPCWRGPRGDGSSEEAGVPTRWDGAKGENIAWKVEIPGKGHASPIIHGDRIFLVSCVEADHDRVLFSLDRKTGKMLWRRSVLKSPLEKKHALNSYASSTPATDGELVYVTFLEGTQQGEAKGANMAVAAYDYDGNRKWLVRPGPFSSVHGYCSCPVLFEDKVIVNGDHDGDAYLVALDRQTGEIAWKTPRENKTRSYSTPIIRDIDGRTQMILSGSLSVASYDPRTGSRHWIIDGPTEQFVASMVYNGKYLFMTAGFPEHHILAIRPDGRGNVTDTHIVWRTKENTSYVPSPVAVGDYFLIVSDAGIASCYEAETGRRAWKQRIGPHYSASLVSANGLAYFLSDEGKMTIVKPGQEYEAVAVNELGEPCYASPAISRSQIFLRAEKHLYAIGQEDQRASAR